MKCGVACSQDFLCVLHLYLSCDVKCAVACQDLLTVFHSAVPVPGLCCEVLYRERIRVGGKGGKAQCSAERRGVIVRKKHG